MNVLICHERFLFRFGADRVMILIGKGLSEAGHRVTFLGNRFDEEVLRPFAHRTITVPADCAPLHQNEYTVDWLLRNWDKQFYGRERPDVVLVGGWPFLAAIPLFRRLVGPTVFMDHGVVPLDSYEGEQRRVLEKLVQLRRQHLRRASIITGVSDFVLQTQSIPDSQRKVPTLRVWNGADHMDSNLWSNNSRAGRALATVRDAAAIGRKTILSLGRWEPGSYKNSEAAFALASKLRSELIDCAILTLSDDEKHDPAIVPIGFPDDAELQRIMREVDLGVSFSQWEGFNLPLAEMQWLGKPVLALDIGAHPEVVVDKWYLCRDEDELASKALQLLRAPRVNEPALQGFRELFTWARVNQQYKKIVESLYAGSRRQTASGLQPISVILDVTNAVRDPANSGVIRVTRRLARSLQDVTDPLFVIWDSGSRQYVLPTKEEFDQLSQFNGPTPTSPDDLSPAPSDRRVLDQVLAERKPWRPVLLMTETMIEREFEHIRSYAAGRSLTTAAIFYDAIPVLRPELCNREMRENHAAYMRGLASCDLVLPISSFSQSSLLDLWREWGIRPSPQVHTAQLPGEFEGVLRNEAISSLQANQVRILCVSTVEPRKNHRLLLAAFLRMQRTHPELDCSLTLVGNRYAGADDLAEYVQRICRENEQVQWLGVVDDPRLSELYRTSSFTVYSSTIEGFGMPIVESLWHGRPCLCHSSGVMAELAQEGGC
ncbi:MAG TPA: glycosyltransferase, partial [Bryobacteraceae bacterium]|nr:glycosyltransferase [Bryobacteraceae bacterium]